MIGLPEIIVLVALALLLFLPLTAAAVVIWVFRRKRKIAALCTQCGASREATLEFCTRCGTPFNQPSSS